MIEFPNQKFKIILADPPWTYDDKALAGDRGLTNKYGTMSLDELKALPVKDIAEDDSFLFLWVTNPLLHEGLEVLKAWGFEYKTVAFTWVKETINGLEFIGMGNYTRANPELCLLGKKGKPKVIDHSIRNHTRARMGKHSQKPDIIRKNIVRLCGDVPRIELFARTKIFGWATWGNDQNLLSDQLENWMN